MEPLIEAFVERGLVLVVRYDKNAHSYRVSLERGEKEPFRGNGPTFEAATRDLNATLEWVLDDILADMKQKEA